MSDTPHIQAGSFKKVSGVQSVTFPQAYPDGHPPIVVVSSFWKHNTIEVSHIETLVEISEEGFTVSSLNKGVPPTPPVEYFVNWIAVPRSS